MSRLYGKCGLNFRSDRLAASQIRNIHRGDAQIVRMSVPTNTYAMLIGHFPETRRRYAASTVKKR